MSTYTANQRALAASPGGLVAAKMFPGTRWRTESGIVVVIWLGWVPDLAGHAEAAAERYHWPLDSTGHNTEIGISAEGRTERVPVAQVAYWTEEL